MLDKVEKSSIHVALVSKRETINDYDKETIDYIFSEAFGEDHQNKVSEAVADHHVEIIYEVKTPIMKNDDIFDEFYKDLRFVFSELQEYSPHFTQLKGEEIK